MIYEIHAKQTVLPYTVYCNTASAFTFTHVTPLKIVIFFKMLPSVYEGVMKDRGYLERFQASVLIIIF